MKTDSVEIEKKKTTCTRQYFFQMVIDQNSLLKIHELLYISTDFIHVYQ